tara:strand:- start:168 stop:482 length:315 start_codon:yes stop_codon:yes gene_type:complete
MPEYYDTNNDTENDYDDDEYDNHEESIEESVDIPENPYIYGLRLNPYSNQKIKCNECFCDMEKNKDLLSDDEKYYCSDCWGDTNYEPTECDNVDYDYDRIPVDF